MNKHTFHKLVQESILVICCLLLGHCTTAEEVDEHLKRIIHQHYQALQQKDLDTALSLVHTESETYHGLKTGQPSMFKRFDYHYELSDIKYLGNDGNYAYQSLKLKKTHQGEKVTEYDNTLSDLVVVYAKQDSNWRIWTSGFMHWLILQNNDKPAAGQKHMPKCDLCQRPNMESLASSLTQLVQTYYDNHNTGSFQTSLERIHPESGLYKKESRRPRPTRSQALLHEKEAKALYPVLPRHELSNIQFIGVDKQYAYLSLAIKKSRSEGLFAGLDDSIRTLLFVFTEHAGEWHIWQEHKLAFEYMQEHK